MPLSTRTYHADYLSLIKLSGLWFLFERWKRQRVLILASQNIEGLWDFTDFDNYSSQSVESLESVNSGLTWFWEPAHYKQNLDNRMLQRMLFEDCPDQSFGETYGRFLTADDIDVHLNEIRLNRDLYFERNPQHINDISEILAGS